MASGVNFAKLNILVQCVSVLTVANSIGKNEMLTVEIISRGAWTCVQKTQPIK